MVNPYAILAGLTRQGVGCFDGVGAALPSELRWPEDRKQGLTFGELYTLDVWMRNYGAPTVAGTPDSGDTSSQAYTKILARWESLQLPGKLEMRKVFTAHMQAWGVGTYAKPDGTLHRDPHKAFDIARIGWPKSGALLDKIRKVGVDAWRRYWAAMAIGRDLFAEQYQQVGGVELGLQDTVENLQGEGVAASGRWEALAGRWVWKGWDALSRPLLASNALLPAPAYAPQDKTHVQSRNASIWRFIADLLGSTSEGPAAAAQLVPELTRQYNQLALLVHGTQQISTPPASVHSLPGLFTGYYNLLGLDVYAQLKSYAGEDFANVVRDEAAARYPIAGSGGALFQQPIVEPPADPICPSVYQPVQGTDGKTYGNECLAKAAGVKVVSLV